MSRTREQFSTIRVIMHRPELIRLKQLIEDQPQERSDMRLYLKLKRALEYLEGKTP